MTATAPVRLTSYSHGAGCACKLGPNDLAQVLSHIPMATDARVLVDASNRDDAAVFKLTDDRALVATVDFFTPVVDDPYDFGRVAAANALSDVYAMGGTPLLVLNLVGWPREKLPFELLGEILRGGSEIAHEAGAFVLGGHSVDDPEPKYGMVAIGEVHPDRIVTNAGAKPGDVLILTKPIGTGVLTTALKRDLLPAPELAPAVRSMTTLNAGAGRALRAAPVHADRKSTRLNSSHPSISYAVFCLKKKKQHHSIRGCPFATVTSSQHGRVYSARRWRAGRW